MSYYSDSDDEDWFPQPTSHPEIFTVYGKHTCPYCVKAVELLEDNDIMHTFYDLNAFEDTSLLEEIVPSHHNTIPIIFKGDIFIGGYDDLDSLLF